MANEGQYPKIDGDYFYGTEANLMMGGFYDDVRTYTQSVTTTSSTLDLSSVNYKYSLIIKNTGDVDCYITFTTSATTNGFRLSPDTSLTLINTSFNSISAITSSSSTTLSVIVEIISNKTGYFTNSEILNISASTSSSSSSFTDTTHYKSIIIQNIGTTDTYVNLDTTATTSNYLLSMDKTLIINNTNKSTISAITATGTSTINVLGVW